ncbi:MAG: hypothetical protein WB797_07995 [Nocardioides sp.]
MTPRRWVGRAVLAGLLVLAAVGVGLFEHTTPDLLRLVLLVGAMVAVLGLVLDFTTVSEPDWKVVSARPVVPDGQDAGLSRTVRLFENHLTSRTVEPTLQRRLRQLTDTRLAELGLKRGDPGVEERLGPTLCDVLDSPARQLSRDTLEECLSRIEELSS